MNCSQGIQIRRSSRWRCFRSIVAVAAIAAPAAVAVGDNSKGPQVRKFPTRLPPIESSPPEVSVTAASPQPAIDALPEIQPKRHQVVPAQVVSAVIRQSDSKAEAEEIPHISDAPVAGSTRWLPSTSALAKMDQASRLLAQARHEYHVKAWLSAETSAWEALRCCAEAIDLSESHGTPEVDQIAPDDRATARLQAARTAMVEARDFSGTYSAVDSQSIARMAKSHHTKTNLRDKQFTVGLTATDASDLYLDTARVALASIATKSPQAAQTLDLLAAIYMSRGDAKQLPGATALCLRRAAIQGDPRNADLATRLGMHLADLGLWEEARWALEHSLSLRPHRATADALVNVLRCSGHAEEALALVAKMQQPSSDRSLPHIRPPRPKIPQITQLSPAEFAALSKPVMNQTADATQATTRSDSVQAKPASTGPRVSLGSTTDRSAEEKPGMIRSFFGSLRNIW